jgi:hypothetical protein
LVDDESSGGYRTAVIGLTIAAFALPHRPRSPSHRPAATPWLVGAVTFAVLIAPNAIDIVTPASRLTATWAGVALNLLLLAVLALVIARWSAPRLRAAQGSHVDVLHTR